MGDPNDNSTSYTVHAKDIKSVGNEMPIPSKYHSVLQNIMEREEKSLDDIIRIMLIEHLGIQMTELGEKMQAEQVNQRDGIQQSLVLLQDVMMVAQHTPNLDTVQ